MVHTPVPGALVLAAAFVATMVLILFGRLILRLLFRFFFRPIRKIVALIWRRIVIPFCRWILRPFVKLARRKLAGGVRIPTPAKRGAPAGIGAASFRALVLFLETGSLADIALGAVPESVKVRVDQKGSLFHYTNANRAVEGMLESLSIDEARANIELAKKYYEKTIDNDQVSPAILYEDSEEALIIEILRDADTTFFWVLRGIRKNVGGNIVRILALMTLLVAAFPFALEWLTAGFQHQWTTPNIAVYGVVILIFFVVLVLLRWTFYANSARYNGQHLNYFVQTYFSRLLNQYKSAATSFSNMLNDRTARLDAIDANSSVWFVNLHWLSARQWLLDLYVRNIEFQIGRDRMWHLITVPFSFGLLFSASLLCINYFVTRYLGMQVSTTYKLNWSAWTTAVPFGVMLLTYFMAWRKLLHGFWEEITPQGWPTFHAMDFKEAIEKNIGPIVREVVDKRRNPYGAAAPPGGSS